MIIYRKDTGDIIANVPETQNIHNFVENYSIEVRQNVASIAIDDVPRNLENYKIVNGGMVKRANLEIEEKRKYGRVLTKEERQLNKLKPSPEEVRKAEQTVEILTLIQEVM